MLRSKSVLSLIFFVLVAVSTFGQTYGKLFNKNEADKKNKRSHG